MTGKKVSAHLLGAALAAILIWALRQFAKIEVPAEIAVAFGTVAAVAVVLVMPDKVVEE
jgi:hypothetical protein